MSTRRALLTLVGVAAAAGAFALTALIAGTVVLGYVGTRGPYGTGAYGTRASEAAAPTAEAPVAAPNPAEPPPPRTELENRVRDFLDRSGAAAGVDALATVGTEWCDAPGESRGVGRVVLPIFVRYDSGDEPFAAVTALWREEGLADAESALGRQIWTRKASAAEDIETASIRGTTEGLSLVTTTACSVGP